MNKTDNQELISALADGQLQGEELARGLELAAGEGREAWHAYHVIGEALRSGHVAAGTRSDLFLARLESRLAQESKALPVAAMVAVPTVQARGPAANDWLWKLVAGVASVAAVTAVGWNLWGSVGGAGQPQLAAAPAAIVPVAESRGGAMTMIRDPHLDQLLAAHRQFGGASALQNSSGFMRNATFEGPAR
jgi:sigma-E factor negative regulatory protein RseA